MRARHATCANCETLFLISDSPLGPDKKHDFCCDECEDEYYAVDVAATILEMEGK